MTIVHSTIESRVRVDRKEQGVEWPGIEHPLEVVFSEGARPPHRGSFKKFSRKNAGFYAFFIAKKQYTCGQKPGLPWG